MIAIREILCATDVEQTVQCGLHYSFFVANQFRCALHVVQACPADALRSKPYLSAAQRMNQAIGLHRLRERLEAIVCEAPSGWLGRSSTQVVCGTVTEALLACSDHHRADLIVLGPETEGELVAGRLDQRTRCPILTVPRRDANSALRLSRILLVIEQAKPGLAVEWAALLASHFGASVQLLYRRRALDAVGTEAKQRQSVERTLRGAGIGIDGIFSERGSHLTERVQERAELGRCDLVIMSALLKDDDEHNVAGKLRQSAVLPVLSIRDASPDWLFMDGGFEGRFGAPPGRVQAWA